MSSPDSNPAELELLYIASTLAEARRVEDLLQAEGMEYVVEPDRYVSGVLFRSERVGAFFYVARALTGAAGDLLRRHGLKPAAGPAS